MVAEKAENGSKQTLSDAIGAVFRTDQNAADFAAALSHLAVAMTTASEAHVIRPEDRSPIASSPASATLAETTQRELSEHLQWDAGTPDPIERSGVQAIVVALPGGDMAALVIRLRNPSATLRALAYERLVALSHLSFGAFRHPDLQDLTTLLADVETDIAPETLAGRIRQFADADAVALAWFKGDAVARLALSDQPVATARASLPDMLEAELRDARDPTRRAENIFVAMQGGDTVVAKVDGSRRHKTFLPLVTQAIAQAHGAGTVARRGTARRWARRGAFVLVALGLSLVPVPDARRISAEVISTNARTITAPLSGVILSVEVSDRERVATGESVLLRIDTDDILQELATAEADYSRALLEREAARGARDAAALRNAELEAEGLRARIDLLEARRASATVLAPIDGLVSGGQLDRFSGATVRQGDPIMDVLDPNTLALNLEVTDDLLNRIAEGETGVFRPDFAPSQTFAGTVAWISPAKSERSDITTFRGRATLPDDTGTLRPGLRGVFAFERGFKPIYRVVWDGLRDWVLLRLWI